jgi:ribonuclease BN (tRNA processing enzyme)
MKLKVLGCSGGIGGEHLHTTSFQIDHDILIDAGTGVCKLPLDALAAIDHVFLTHAHLDHIAALPLLIDSVTERRHSKPITVYGLPDVLGVLKQHIFNWAVWPDFSEIPSREAPSLCYQEVMLGQSIALAGRILIPLPADHTVPACGYRLDSGSSSLVLSGDSGPCNSFWESLNEIENLRCLIVECAFPNELYSLAKMAKHYTPSLLLDGLRRLKVEPDVYVTHLKPGKGGQTIKEISLLQSRKIHHLQHNAVIEF